MATFAIPRGEPLDPKEDCSPFDIGFVYSTISKASPAEKFRFINNVWKPSLNYSFPASAEAAGKLRKCRHEWLVRFTWLVYSKYLDGVFCLLCRCFGIQYGKNAARLQKLFRSPLTFWTTAVRRLQNHSSGKCETHSFSVVAMANFMDVMTRRTVAIDKQLNQITFRQIQQNREKMRSIIKTVVFCGQNAVALRGARDDNPDDETLQGNFHALLAFRVDSGDKTLQEHFENAPRNATYRSKTIQNEIINTVGSYITSKISAEIKESKLFSVLADEAADISNKQQLSLVLRFVDSSQQIREEFVGFYHCEYGTSGVALKEMILKAVADLGLPMANCRGQSYDGAGDMAGKYNGVSSLIQGQFSKAFYVHCMNHRLNLCVADTCSEYLVKDMMSVVRSLFSFFSGSPKRQQHLKEKVKSLLPASKHEVLINVCETRWIARLDGLDRIVELLLPVVCTIEDIAHNRKGGDEESDSGDWNQNSKAAAKKMLPSITFQFVVTLVIVRYVLDLTRPAL
ncbi:52 kDa repressor of the inhibitor of the kinase-like [Paramuricea clavata]|uniref:52 kDa repressor of the inhibitor of the kinase-like n=1 Tax=Paramuricea clavata TaxID=317549 RepID=A0A7D9EZP9_PARCT|nr:52 kDa repressor of the inhibitor of the kinase-like [Paramuricea clavata]